MRYFTLVTVPVLALGLASCGKTSDSTTATTDSATTSATTTTADASAPAMGDASGGSDTAMANTGQGFANAAAASDAFEIATSKLAATNATSAKVKHFAQQMIAAHTESTAKLKKAASSATPAITPSPALSADQQQTLDSLQSKKGADFDKAYASAQVDAHTKTLDALKSYSTGGDVAALKSFATAMIPIVTAHLNMAKGL